MNLSKLNNTSHYNTIKKLSALLVTTATLSTLGLTANASNYYTESKHLERSATICFSQQKMNVQLDNMTNHDTFMVETCRKTNRELNIEVLASAGYMTRINKVRLHDTQDIAWVYQNAIKSGRAQ